MFHKYGYKYDTKIGLGSSGEIYKSTDKDGRECAIKTIICNKCTGISASTLYELMTMEKANIYGIAKIKDYFITDNSDVTINIVLSYFPDNLLNYIINNDIDTYKTNKIFVEIVKALYYLESMGQYHGDLSSKNIMLDQNLNPVIIDLASSRKFRRKPINSPTMDVCPIEMLTSESIHTSKIDVWALGCLFYMMLSQDAIADGTSKEDCVTRINEIFESNNDNSNEFASKINYSFIGIEYRNLIKTMINIDPIKRISINQLINNKFIKQMDITLNAACEYDKTTYNPTYKHNTNILSVEDRGKMIDLLMNLQRIFEVSLETVHIAIHIIDTVQKKVHMDNIVLFLMAFSISCKIVSDFDISIVDINTILENFHKDSINVKMHATIIIDICSKSKWDIDPINLYDYIHLLNNDYKDYMNYLLITTVVSSEIVNYDILTRILSLYIIIKCCKDDQNSDIFLKSVKNKMNPNINFSLITNCVKVILHSFLLKYTSHNNSSIKQFIQYSTKYCANFNSLMKNLDANNIMENIVLYLI